MNCCYICQAEAISRCYTCGQLICGTHGGENCQRCDNAVVAGDPRGIHVSAAPLAPPVRLEDKRGWWRPQPAEDYAPPACYACKGLARVVCRNCRSHFCRDHAGKAGLCQECSRSARLGLIVLFVAIAMMLAVIFLGSFVR